MKNLNPSTKFLNPNKLDEFIIINLKSQILSSKYKCNLYKISIFIEAEYEISLFILSYLRTFVQCSSTTKNSRMWSEWRISISGVAIPRPLTLLGPPVTIRLPYPDPAIFTSFAAYPVTASRVKRLTSGSLDTYPYPYPPQARCHLIVHHLHLCQLHLFHLQEVDALLSIYLPSFGYY